MKKLIVFGLLVFVFGLANAEEKNQTAEDKQPSAVSTESSMNDVTLSEVGTQAKALEKKANPHKMHNMQFLSKRPYMETIKD